MAVLDDQHLVLGGAEGQLLDDAGMTQFLWGQLAESGHDAASGGDGDELECRFNFYFAKLENKLVFILKYICVYECVWHFQEGN